MLGLHTTTAARLFADPTAKTHAVVTDYDKTTSFTLAASLCLLTGVIITPLVYKLYHWVNSKVMTEQALPFAKKAMHATIVGEKDSGYRELKVGDKVYGETIKYGRPVITVKDIRTSKTLELKDDLVAQVRDMTLESDQKENQDEAMGSEEDRSMWQEAADWVSTLLGLNPDVRINGHMFLEDIQSSARIMVARAEAVDMLGDTSKPSADPMKKELAEIHCIYADFKGALDSDDTYGMDERTEACINYFQNNSKNLETFKEIFSDDNSNQKLKTYLDACRQTGKNSYERGDDDSGLFFTNLGSAVNTLHSAMTYLARLEKEK